MAANLILEAYLVLFSVLGVVAIFESHSECGGQEGRNFRSPNNATQAMTVRHGYALLYFHEVQHTKDNHTITAVSATVYMLNLARSF